MPCSDDNPSTEPIGWLVGRAYQIVLTVRKEYVQDYEMLAKIVLKVGDGELYPDEVSDIDNLVFPAHDTKCDGTGTRSWKLYPEFNKNFLALEDLIRTHSHVPPLKLLLADFWDLAVALKMEQTFGLFDIANDVLLFGYSEPSSCEECYVADIWAKNPTQFEQTPEGIRSTRYGLKDRLDMQIWKYKREKKKCRDEQAQKKSAEELVQNGNASSDPTSKTTDKVSIEMGGGGKGSTKEDDGDDGASTVGSEHGEI